MRRIIFDENQSLRSYTFSLLFLTTSCLFNCIESIFLMLSSTDDKSMLNSFFSASLLLCSYTLLLNSMIYASSLFSHDYYI